MKRKVFAAAVALLAAGSVWAQTEQNGDFTDTVEYSKDKYKVETNPFWSNWFISAGFGGQVFFGDHDRQASFGDRIAPALDIAVGKWFTPGIGIRFMYSGLQAKGATQRGDQLSHSTGEYLGDDKGWTEAQKFDMFNLHADVLFNMSNLLCGYNETRVYNCSPYAGIGWGRVWDSPQAKEFTANVGILNTFRLSNAFDLNLDIRAMLTDDAFDGEVGGRANDAMLTATVGVTYNFGTRDWNKAKTVIRYDNAAINELRAQMDELAAENARLKKALAEGNKKEAEVIVKKLASSSLIIFQIGKSKLSNEARANLGMLAEVIKTADPNAVYTITGYADAGTGSKKLNERLSKARAQAVYDCLVKEFGVSESQLRMDYKGGVDNMFYNDPRLSRAVITRSSN